MKLYLLTCAVCLVFLTFSCVPHRNLINYQENLPVDSSLVIANQPEIRIQPNDVLRIDVFSSDPSTVAPFNVSQGANNNVFDSDAIQLNGYLVDANGNIFFPVVGEINVKGLSINEVKNLISNQLIRYLKDPVVNVRLLNFKVTVSGEVKREGSFNVFNERISIPEAIARAGGLTDYADREEILLIREEDGVRTTKSINLLSADIFASDYFYLKQNDLIYIKPIRAKTGAVNDQTSKTIPLVTAAATLAAVIISITSNNNN